MRSYPHPPIFAGLMTLAIVIGLAVATLLLLIIERRGVRTTLVLTFKGDIKRESLFLQQYGQSVATPIAAWLMAIAKGRDWAHQWRVFVIVCTPVLMTSALCAILKRCLGRHRPNRERAGAFTGFEWKHDNKRESFPSSHSACAFALSVALVHYWPEAAIVFWLLAGITALLRYVLDAHFPSDVLAGCLLGLVLGQFGVGWMERLLFPS